MSTCIERIACKDCDSSDSLQVFLNIDEALGMEYYSSFCFGTCYQAKGDPYTGTAPPKIHVKTEEEIRLEAEEILTCPIFKPKKDYRGIPSKFYENWGCRTLYSEFDGKTPYAVGFPYYDFGFLSGWKVRPFKKKDMFGIGRTASCDPFGFARAMKLVGNVLWITEGEFDAIALDYCLSLVGTRESYPVVSLTHGWGSLPKNFEYIKNRVFKKFKYIVLVLDDDENGKRAEQNALEIWPDNVYIVSKPKGMKDANDAVKAGLGVDMGNLALNFMK